MNEFKRMILKVSDVSGVTATVPTTNDHTDGSWLNTDIYEGELFLNIVDNILQTRTESGIILVNSASSSDAQRVVKTAKYDEAVIKGDPLRITGYNVGSGIVTVAKADSSNASLMASYGLASANYSSGATGTMIVSGDLTNIDTSAFTSGDKIYVAVGGGLTSTKPIEPNLIQNVGFVSRSNVSTGAIQVVAIGRVNDVPNLEVGFTFIGTATNPIQYDLITALDSKQDTLVSGTNIKTINGSTVLGSGNLQITTTDQWGDISGTLSNQTDLQNELNDKQDNLVSGTNIKSINGSTVLGSGDLVIDTSDAWGDITGTLSDQTDLNTALDNTTLIATLTVGTDRTLILTDRDKNIENDNSITITIPLNSSVAFPIGTQIFFTKKFETLTIAGAGGVTINSVDSLLELGRLNCGASLLKVDTDEWNLIGELI